MTESVFDTLKVIITGDERKPKARRPRRQIRSVAHSVTLGGGTAANQVSVGGLDGNLSILLEESPNRVCAAITVVGGAAGDLAYLCTSAADARVLKGCPVVTGQVVQYFPGTSEIWVAAAVGKVLTIGAIAGYEK